MGIRLTIVGAFLHVLLALGVLTAVIEYVLVRAEREWGLQQEAQSVALGIASFIEASRREAHSTRMSDVWSRVPSILKLNTVRGIAVIAADLSDSEKYYGADAEMLRADSTMAHEVPFVSEPFENSRGIFVKATYPIRDLEGNVIAAVKILLDAGSLQSELAALQNSLIIRVILLSALALPAGWLFGTLFIRRLERSYARAREISSNPEPRPVVSTNIRELDDVNEMVEILAALLEERRSESPARAGCGDAASPGGATA